MLGVDVVGALQAFGTLIAAIAAIVSAFHANAAKNNTTTPNGEPKNVGALVTDVAHSVEEIVHPSQLPGPTAVADPTPEAKQ